MAYLDDAPTQRSDHPPSSDRDSKVQVDASPLDAPRPSKRYQIGGLLGAGGMGEVKRCRDVLIGRDVAMKTVRADAADVAFVRDRFLREARVQGQLEHPCIVPVYDLGVGDDGEAYFTMKRIRGETLEHIIERLRSNDEAARARWTRRRLLAAFVTACGAVAYAHARGVLHRDLKPANVMLGDYGEVYVLDWGVARVLDAPDDTPGELVVEPLPEAGRTVAGAVVGTAGYMPVEQLAGVEDLDARADVYALGAILFELLTLRCLHEGKSLHAVIASTVTGADARASVRAPDREIPPELDAVCARATARDRGGRYASAHALREAVEQYLDGDRDLERRRALAQELAASAEAAAEEALAGNERLRGDAIRDVGRALALDPGHRAALRTFVRLLVAPPKETPAEVTERMVTDDRALHQSQFRSGAMAFAIWLAFTPFALWVGVRERASFAVMVALIAGCAALSALVGRTGRGLATGKLALMALTTGAVALSGRILGPFILVPSLCVVVTFIFSLTPDRAPRWHYLAMGAVGMLAPVVVELSGALGPSYAFRDGTLELHARMVDLPPLPLFVSLVAIHLGMLVAVTSVAARLRETAVEAARRIHVQAWQLRQIVPEEAAAPPATP